MKKIKLLKVSMILLVSSNVQAITVVQFNGFNSTAGLTLSGNAAMASTVGDGNVLRLTPAEVNKAGSVFSDTKINAAKFSSFFKFRVTEPGGITSDDNTDSGADGLVFVVQNVSSSIGSLGGGIGYSGISNSVGIEWDTWHNSSKNDPSSNHLGINVNGNVNHGTGAPDTLDVGTRFDDANIWYSWVDYDGTNLEVRTNQTGLRSADADLSKELDLVTILGDSSAYVGFTSGTGAAWGNHDILSWEYRSDYRPISNVPVPAGIWLMGSALVGMIGFKRKK